MGASWTWAHGMAESGTVPKYNPLSLTGYSPQGVRHLLVVNWVYAVPNGSRIWSNFVTKAVLDNWSYSGIATFSTGTRENIEFLHEYRRRSHGRRRRTANQCFR